MSKLMISVSGIRGIYGESLTPDLAVKFAAQFGIICGRGKIIIGRDSRTTGEALMHAVVSGLLSVGCDVVNLGIVATPTVLLAVEESNAMGGLAITASHNPQHWNAFKLVDQNGMFFFPERAQAYQEQLKKEIEYASWDKMGKYYEDTQATQRHIQKILDIPYLDIEKIKSKGFRVVLDSVNGAGGLISPLLLKALGCEVIEMNSQANGHFAHVAEPLKENLTDLCRRVKEEKADLGFATDPDVDRLAIVDNNGDYIGEEFSLLLAEEFVLPIKKGDLVLNLSSSMASDDIAKKYGVNVHRTKVGEINVGKKMKEISAPIGGEGNGGIIIPEVHYTRDAPAGMAIILALLTRENRPLSEIVNDIPHYYFHKAKIETKAELLDPIIAKAHQIYADYDKDLQDGLKIIGKDFWIHIRKSGTEPIIRVYVESPSAERSKEIALEAIANITNI
ncbi:phosphoglucosamine mutase [bacterium]|nr:phosphoglucosamine mutase [bacterium]